uniref:Reverse transcriptase domain-containing protein n=1 Tax=Fagus sylvatica TaxID=28930 RepID=A0A2N9IM41_FAGSY
MGVNNDVIVATKQEINHLLLSEELHWRQRSRMVWLEAGDQNTKFFHNYANQRQRTNGIQGLRNQEDVWCTAENQVEDIAVNYFRNIFTTSHPTRIGETLSAVEKVVSEETNQRLLQPFTPEEVRTALVQMHPSKAPGADGMPSFFYQKYWHIVGTSVTSAVLSVLNSDSQSAFVPGRMITDNVSVAFEVLHKMKAKRRGRKGEMAVKLDMSKAYDRVEWPFTIQYSVLLEGVPKGYIIPTRGLRQGDPLSPYLFLLCAEGLSALLKKSSTEGQLKGLQTNRLGPWVSHLFFADDSLLFGKASLAESREFMKILKLYEESSDQQLNREKTTIFFSSNTLPATRQAIQDFWGSNGVQNFDKYLGLPALIGGEGNFNQSSRAGAIPTYTMNCFRLPKSWCDEVNSLIAQYWWGQSTDKRKIHWLKWDKLCTAKEDGGIGFRNLHMFNTALLSKQCWRLLENQQSLFFRVFKAKYFPSCVRWIYKLGSLPQLSWSETKTGIFTVKSAYHLLEKTLKEESRGESSSAQIFRWLWRKNWKLSIPGKIKHFIWRAFHESLPTSHNLFRRKIIPNPFCKVCDQEVETTSHALWTCPMAQNTWALVPRRVQKLPNQGDDFARFMVWIFQNFSKEAVEDWATTSWSIWSARNCYLFEAHQKSPQFIRTEALNLLREYRQVHTPNRPL